MSQEEDRQFVFDALDEAWNDFVFHSRKRDANLSPRKLDQIVHDGIVTKEEIMSHFQRLVERWGQAKR